MKELSITVGLPLSGKSSYANHVKNTRNSIIVCPDIIRAAIQGNISIKKDSPFVWAIAETMVRALLMGNHSVIVDACNGTKEHRAIWQRVANEFGIELTIYIMQATYYDCTEQSRKRNLDSNIITKVYSEFEFVTEDEGRTSLVSPTFKSKAIGD